MECWSNFIHHSGYLYHNITISMTETLTLENMTSMTLSSTEFELTVFCLFFEGPCINIHALETKHVEGSGNTLPSLKWHLRNPWLAQLHIYKQSAATVRKAQKAWPRAERIKPKKVLSVIITFLNGTKKEKSAEMIEKACGLAHAVNFPWASLTIWGDSHSGTRHPPTYNTRTHTQSVVPARQYGCRNLWEEACPREDDWQEVGED